ncbi:MAG: ABC transporter ATP-binding protein [Bacillota bacterium]|nr:ABC transporter ATP-binding protein [Bacillota bacterium]
MQSRDASDLVVLDRAQKHFVITKGLIRRSHRAIRAVDDVSLSIHRGETFGLVGESGSGKTTLARLIPRLTRLTGGRVSFDGRDIDTVGGSELTRIRRRMGIVFQDPASSLSPRATVRGSVIRPLQLQGAGAREAAGRLLETVELVNLGPELLERYPHQLSGGQQQRASIARAIILRPELLILDEPTSALDVSVQAQILNLLLELQREFGLTYLFITHNLSVVRYMSDRIGVMYLGKLVEVGPAAELYARPLHPYTAALLSASPPQTPRLRQRRKFALAGDPPSLIDPPAGCHLHPRCAFTRDICRQERPALRAIGLARFVACHFAEQLALQVGD